MSVAAKVGEPETIAPEVSDEAGCPAAMLDIGPAIFGRARQVKAVAGGDERKFFGRNPVDRLRAGFHACVGRSRPRCFLQRASAWSEKGVEICLRHGHEDGELPAM